MFSYTHTCVCMFSCVWLFVTQMACSPPCSSVHGIFLSRILDYSSWGSSWPRDWTCRLNFRLLHLLHWQVDSLPLHHWRGLGQGCLMQLLTRSWPFPASQRNFSCAHHPHLPWRATVLTSITTDWLCFWTWNHRVFTDFWQLGWPLCALTSDSFLLTHAPRAGVN